MKLHCHRPSLSSAFQVVSGVVPARTPKDILKNVKLQVADGRAMLIGTDQEVGIRVEVPGVEADADGETLLPTNRIVSILREATDDAVNLDITQDTVCVRCGHSEFRLSAIDAAEFPPVPAFEDTDFHLAPAHTFREMIRRTAFATDVESTRYALGGVLLELQPESITLAATDTRRLAVTTAAGKVEGNPQPQNATPVVPTKAMSLAERSFDDGENNDVRIAVHANDALLQQGNVTIYSRLVEGRFPQYKDVIPAESNVTIELVAGPFHAAVRQSQIVTDDDSRGVEFAFSNGLLTLKSQSAEVGQSKIELPISYDYQDLSITFDPRYVAEFLRVLEPESQVALHLTDAENAAVLRTDDAYTYVIMPLSKDR